MANIEKIKQNITIKDVLGIANIGIRNNAFRAVWRGDNHASVVIGSNSNGETWKDLATGEKGSVIDLYSLLFNVDFKTSLAELESKFFLGEDKVPTRQVNQKTVYKPNQHKLEDGLKFSAIYEHLVNCNPLEGKGLEYCNNRGFETSFLKSLKFGYIAGDKATYHRVSSSLKKRFDMRTLQKAGLFNENLKFKGYLDCVIIPYLNADGDIVNLQFRALDKEAKAKYLYLKGIKKVSYLFDSVVSSLELYAKAKEKATVYITEGVFNALCLIQEGNLAFALGSSTSLKSWGELQEMAKYNPNIVLCLDPDTAGEGAVKELGARLYTANPTLTIQKLNLPEGKDINDLYLEKYKNNNNNQ